MLKAMEPTDAAINMNKSVIFRFRTISLWHETRRVPLRPFQKPSGFARESLSPIVAEKPPRLVDCY
jgi:hypothetical protein